MATINKPALDLVTEALRFATEGQAAPPAPLEPIKTARTGQSANRVKKTAQAAPASAGNTRIFFAPAGDKRLTINLREDLHKRLKIAAIEQGKTAGEIIEDLLERNI